MRMTALSRSAVYALMAESRFPKPIRTGSRAVRWIEQEVLDFIGAGPEVAPNDRPHSRADPRSAAGTVSAIGAPAGRRRQDALAFQMRGVKPESVNVPTRSRQTSVHDTRQPRIGNENAGEFPTRPTIQETSALEG